MPDQGDEGLGGLYGLVEKDLVDLEFVLWRLAESAGYGFGESGRPEGKSSRSPAVVVFEQVFVLAVAGQLPDIAEAVGLVVEGLAEQGRKRVVWSPEKAADVAESRFFDQL